MNGICWTLEDENYRLNNNLSLFVDFFIDQSTEHEKKARMTKVRTLYSRIGIILTGDIWWQTCSKEDLSIVLKA